MDNRYRFDLATGFPNLLVRPSALPAAILLQLESATAAEYQRLAGIEKAAASDYVSYIGELPELEVDNLLSTELVEVSQNGRLTVDRVYWEAGFLYSIEPALIRKEASRRLRLAANKLPEPFGLVLLDAWRKPEQQEHLYRLYYPEGSALEEGFVSRPTLDLRKPAPHTTGGAVDVTLSFEGIPLGLGTNYDEFSKDSYANADANPEQGISELEWELRRILYSAMYESDFVVFLKEWWHFEYGTRLWSASTGRPALFGRADLANQF
jgi:zinc D-Ala-D-Ala dipeptidase